VEDEIDTPTAVPPSQDTVMADSLDAAIGEGGGMFLGIPHGWPLILAILALIALMWMARTPMRRVIWQAFFVSGRLFGRWGLWLRDHGRAARLATAEVIIAHRSEELSDRMLVLEDRIGRRTEGLARETGQIVARLDSSTHALATSAADLGAINVEDAAERAFRAALPQMESGRGLSKLERTIAQSTARAMNDRLTPVRPALTLIKTEAPRIREVADRLGKIELRFNQGAETINKSFSAYEDCLRSPERIAVAGRQSVIIPWLIAIIITGIALSGVFLNFFLIQRPMAEIVGESARIGGIGLPTFAAIIVIFLEFIAGVVLMDAAGFTRLIPAFHTMSDGAKRIMFWVAFAFLASFSFLEATLAIVREQIIETEQETRALANAIMSAPEIAAEPAPGAGTIANPDPTSETAAPEAREGLQLITMAQIVLAVLIPWLLAIAALPLETIVRNTVFMLQIAGAQLMLVLAFLCRTMSAALKSLGLFVLAIYDLIIFAPLWIERRAKGLAAGSRDEPPPNRDRDRPDNEPQSRSAPGASSAKPQKSRETAREPELQKA
jgi:hypothetical protein